MNRALHMAAAFAACGVLLLAPAPAEAVADCSVSAVGVNFLTYDPLSASPDDSTGSVTVSCTNTPPGGSTVNYVVALSPGNSGSAAQRELRAGTAKLLYNLFANNAHSQIWGNGTAGTVVASGSFSLSGNQTRTRTHTVYGRIPALQDVAIGNYSDSIVVTLTF